MNPPLPAGYALDQPPTGPATGLPPLPPGYKMDTPAAGNLDKIPLDPPTPGLLSGEYSGPTGTVAPGEGLDHAVARQAIGGVGSAVKGIAGMAKALVFPPDDTLGRVLGPGAVLVRPQLDEGKKAYQLAKEGRYSEAAGHGIAAVTPAVGPMVAGATEKAVTGTVGPAAELATYAAAPKLAEKAAPVVGKLVKAPGSLLRRGAESVAESSLGVTNKGRAFGKTPGAAALSETKGFVPEKVLSSSRERLNNIGSKLAESYQAAGAAGRNATLQPALDIIDREIQNARVGQNKGLLDALTAKRERLTSDLANTVTDPLTGQESPAPLGPDIAPERLWKMKQNWGDDTNWNANVDPRIRSKIDRKVYHAMDSELDRVAPGTDELNQRYSSLKTVEKRADVTSRGEDLPGAVIDRWARRTGGAAVGMYELSQGNIPAAVAATVGPEILGRPGPKMALARGMYKLGGGKRVPPEDMAPNVARATIPPEPPSEVPPVTPPVKPPPPAPPPATPPEPPTAPEPAKDVTEDVTAPPEPKPFVPKRRGTRSEGEAVRGGFDEWLSSEKGMTHDELMALPASEQMDIRADFPKRTAKPDTPKSPELQKAIENFKKDQPISELRLDPERFQFREQGAPQGSKPTGPITTWTDPADGKNYVVNGHDRVADAKKEGTEVADIIPLRADDAEHARAIGALHNVAEGQVTPQEAARVLRELGVTRAELEAATRETESQTA